MAGLRALAARVQPGLGPRPLPAPARAGRAPAEPHPRRRRRARARLQYGGQLRHEHELAELRRRVDDEPSHPAGRPDRAELRLRGRRHRRRDHARARDHTPTERDSRELLGRPHQVDDAHPPAARARARPCARRARRRPDAPRPRGRAHRCGRDAGDLPRPGREPGGDQGARHERRRPPQRELRPSVREPFGPDEPPRDVGIARDPVRAHVRLRAPRRRPPTGLGDLRRDARPLGGLGRARDLG